MGVSYRAMAAIGHPVLRENLVRKKMVKAFDHDFGEDARFCPYTGRRLWEEVEAPIDGVDEDLELLMGYPILWSTDREEGVVSVCQAIGHSGETLAYSGVSEFDTVEECRLELKQAFKKAGLNWEDDDFGLYSILYCSH